MYKFSAGLAIGGVFMNCQNGHFPVYVGGPATEAAQTLAHEARGYATCYSNLMICSDGAANMLSKTHDMQVGV